MTVTTQFSTTAEAFTALQSNQLSQADFVQWCDAAPRADFFKVQSKIFAVMDGPTVAALGERQAEMREAANSSKGAINIKISKKGAVSAYGLSAQRPVTLYAGQWKRLLEYVGAPADNPISRLVAANKPERYPIRAMLKADYQDKPVDASESNKAAWKYDSDRKLVAEVQAGGHPNIRIEEGGVLVVTIATKS